MKTVVAVLGEIPYIAPEAYPGEERRCVIEECRMKLSRYNKSNKCHACQKAQREREQAMNEVLALEEEADGLC